MGLEELGSRIRSLSYLRGDFTLRSGAQTDTYFDKYRFESDPEVMNALADAFALRLPSACEVVAGLELGGVPLATAISLRTGIPAAFVRKLPKSYGTRRVVEGVDVKGKRVCVVEDVVTTGGAVVEAVANLRAAGATVDTILFVISRDPQGQANLRAIGVEPSSLFAMDELIASDQ